MALPSMRTRTKTVRFKRIPPSNDGADTDCRPSLADQAEAVGGFSLRIFVSLDALT